VQVTDMVLGMAAGALLLIGLARVFLFEKGLGLRISTAMPLWRNLSIFIVIGLLSIIPTLEFCRGASARRGVRCR